VAHVRTTLFAGATVLAALLAGCGGASPEAAPPAHLQPLAPQATTVPATGGQPPAASAAPAAPAAPAASAHSARPAMPPVEQPGVSGADTQAAPAIELPASTPRAARSHARPAKPAPLSKVLPRRGRDPGYHVVLPIGPIATSVSAPGGMPLQLELRSMDGRRHSVVIATTPAIRTRISGRKAKLVSVPALTAATYPIAVDGQRGPARLNVFGINP
jgi:hypothetical protein